MSQLGFEAAGGMVEKFLPGVSFPVLMNAVIPGFVAAAAVLPLTALRSASFLSLETDKTWPQLIVAAVIVVSLGGLISSLNSEFYKVYEGRIFWPRRLYERSVAWQQQRVERLYREVEAQKDVNQQRYDEAWYRLRVYPFNRETGRRYAARPTLLGNILSGYEDYPDHCYGMDSVFYWPRLWLLVDKDSKQEIGKSWAVADGLLSLSTVCLMAGLAWAGAASGAAFDLWSAERLPVAQEFTKTWLAAGVWLLAAYGFYRLSLPFHRQNGEIFKSLFDLYRDKLRKITSLAPHEAELWDAAWAYLQYLKIRCPKCGKGYFSIFSPTCPNPDCKADLSQALQQVRQTGQLVSLANDNAPKKEDVSQGAPAAAPSPGR
ncbi:MAG TPA: hypothetical protein VI488_03705 [Candidatus Angelobacter sp.]